MNSVLVTIAPAMDAFTSDVLPGAEGGECDHQLGQVAERRVQQAPDRVARLRGHGLGGVAQQGRQGHDGQDGQHEEQRVGVGRELLPGEDRRHEDQQPQQRIVADLLQQEGQHLSYPAGETAKTWRPHAGMSR